MWLLQVVDFLAELDYRLELGRNIFILVMDDVKGPVKSGARQPKGAELATGQFGADGTPGDNADAKVCGNGFFYAFCIVIDSGDGETELLLLHDLLEQIAGAAARFTDKEFTAVKICSNDFFLW